MFGVFVNYGVGIIDFYIVSIGMFLNGLDNCIVGFFVCLVML